MEVIFRRVGATAKSVEDAISLLQRANSRVLSRSGANVLAQIEATSVNWVRQQLPGWIVSPQAERAPVPDARIKINSVG